MGVEIVGPTPEQKKKARRDEIAVAIFGALFIGITVIVCLLLLVTKGA